MAKVEVGRFDQGKRPAPNPRKRKPKPGYATKRPKGDGPVDDGKPNTYQTHEKGVNKVVSAAERYLKKNRK